jgi:hypothetical protein
MLHIPHNLGIGNIKISVDQIWTPIRKLRMTEDLRSNAMAGLPFQDPEQLPSDILHGHTRFRVNLVGARAQ